MNDLLLDSNVIISLAKGDLATSILEEAALTDFFENVAIIKVSGFVITEAVLVRQKKSMSLGDSIIAATAQMHQIPLYTRNTADFKHLKNLDLVDPFEL